MKYKFLGKSDKNFPNLKTGNVYDLEVITRSRFLKGIYPIIMMPFCCPYSSWETFYKNWKPVTK